MANNLGGGRGSSSVVGNNSRALPFRMLETFFDISTYEKAVVSSSSSSSSTSPLAVVSRVVLFCVNCGFFSYVLTFFNARVLVDVQLATHSTPHVTPLAAFILALISVPLQLCDAVSKNGIFSSAVAAVAFSDVVFLSLTQSAVGAGRNGGGRNGSSGSGVGGRNIKNGSSGAGISRKTNL